MKKQITITPSEFSNFLKCGAIFRIRDQWVLVYPTLESDKITKSEVITVRCDDFYEFYQKGKKSPNTLKIEGKKLTLAESELAVLCNNYLDFASTSESELSTNSSILNWKEWSQPLIENFQADFNKIQEKITSGEIRKAVPVVFESIEKTPNNFNRAEMIKSLIEADRNLFVYGVWHETSGVMGATPEILFQKFEDQIEAMALAGTIPVPTLEQKNREKLAQQLRSDKKENFEHSLVVKDIFAKLEKWGNVEIGKLELLNLPNLIHLKTRIYLKLQGKVLNQAYSLIHDLHPTPALGVYPGTEPNLDWLQKLNDQSDRQWHGAPWLIDFADGNCMALVAIRNIQWNNGVSRIGSGCGIVKESKLEKEWIELKYKRLSTKKLLGFKYEEH